jgi:hypothetical protein
MFTTRPGSLPYYFLPSVVRRPCRLGGEGRRPLHQLLGGVHEGAAEDDRVEEDEDAGGGVEGREDYRNNELCALIDI